MINTSNSRPRIKRLITFTAGGALLAGSLSASAFAVATETDETTQSKTGTLIIEKEVINPDGAPIDDLEFTINWVCKGGGEDEDHSSSDKSSEGGGGSEGHGGGGSGGHGGGGGGEDEGEDEGGGKNSGTVTVVAGQPTSIEGIPGNKTCTVTEEAPKAIENFTWGDPTYEPESVQIKFNEKKITVTNTITRDRGSLKIMKELAQGSTAFEGDFTIDYSCQPAPESEGAIVEGDVTIPAGDFEVVKIPTGYTCVVTETTFPSVPGFVWTTPLITGSPTDAIVGGEGEAREVTVVNQLTAAPTPPPPPAPAPEPVPVAEAVTPPATGTAPETTPVVPETPVAPAPGTGVAPTAPVTSVEPAPGTGVPTSVNAGEGPAPSNGMSITMWLLVIAAISAAVTWGLTRWTNTEGDTHMQKVHME